MTAVPDGWRDMAQTLRAGGLPVPPVPVPLRPALRRRGRQWCWTTGGGVTGLDMYMWSLAEAEAVLSGDEEGRDYLAVSHAGHGVNSYAVTYHLVYRGLTVFLQEAWGGIYMDNDARAASLADMFRRCGALIERWDGRGSRRRLLCLESRLRGTTACGWIPADRRDRPAALQRFLRDHGVAPGTALARAEHLLDPPDTGRRAAAHGRQR